KAICQSLRKLLDRSSAGGAFFLCRCTRGADCPCCPARSCRACWWGASLLVVWAGRQCSQLVSRTKDVRYVPDWRCLGWLSGAGLRTAQFVSDGPEAEVANSWVATRILRRDALPAPAARRGDTLDLGRARASARHADVDLTDAHSGRL